MTLTPPNECISLTLPGLSKDKYKYGRLFETVSSVANIIKALKVLVYCRYESSEWGVAELQTC